jgi:hypothetical protein
MKRKIHLYEKIRPGKIYERQSRLCKEKAGEKRKKGMVQAAIERPIAAYENGLPAMGRDTMRF